MANGKTEKKGVDLIEGLTALDKRATAAIQAAKAETNTVIIKNEDQREHNAHIAGELWRSCCDRLPTFDSYETAEEAFLAVLGSDTWFIINELERYGLCVLALNSLKAA